MKLNPLNNTKNNINFQKQLMANCSVLKNNKNYSCKIYQINYTDDKDYFADKKDDPNWENSYYFRIINSFFKSHENDEFFFVIEDKRKNCIGFLNIGESFLYKDAYELYYIETFTKRKQKKFKYIGETLISFAAQFAKSKKIPNILVSSYREEAYGFYKKLGFHTDKLNYDGILIDKIDYEDIKRKNQLDTKGEFEYIG